MLLIRLDAIGDYVLFRNYMEFIKKSDEYKQYSITLLGNQSWKSLSEQLDADYIDKFIWLDRKEFRQDFWYRWKKLQDIVSDRYQIVISPVHSREFFYADNIVKLVNAKEKIGSVGDLLNIKKWQKDISDKYYTSLIDVSSDDLFEFDRNKEFFEKVLNKKIDKLKPEIQLKERKIDSIVLPENYAVIFIGASVDYKKWEISKFFSIANYLRVEYGYNIVLCGGMDDVDRAREFRQYFKEDYLDLVGKTSLIDLLYVIHNSDLIISNETSVPHFAVALDVENIFVIFSGKCYGRFSPYPIELSGGYHAILPYVLSKQLKNNGIRKYKECDVLFKADDVNIDEVKQAVDNMLIKSTY